MYDCTVAISGDEKQARQSRMFWRSSALFSTGITPAADCPKTSDLVCIEDISDTSLPQSTQDMYISPAEKVAQLGADAAEKLLAATTTDVDFSGRRIIYIDLFPHVGSFTQAVVGRKSDELYLAFCPDEVKMEWLRYTFQNHALDLLLREKLHLPEFQVFSPIIISLPHNEIR